MIELPETYVISGQINETLAGKTVKSAVANAHPHAFAWYSGDPASYSAKLAGKTLISSNPGTGYTCGGNTEVSFGSPGARRAEDGDTLVVLSTPVKYHEPGAKLPAKHQLLIAFNDGSHMSCTVQMWGAMFCYTLADESLPDGYSVKKSPVPFDDAFDRAYFDALWDGVKPNLSVKAFLATEQRIPGFGNGVLQDVLWNAKTHPKRKLQDMDGGDRDRILSSVKSTLHAMRMQGGRDTERDLYGNKGGYKTVLSANTLKNPCPACGGRLIREAYLGGNIYYCPVCQPL